MSSILGIDPGTRTGVALVRDGVVMELHTVDFWEAFWMAIKKDWYGFLEKNCIAIEVPHNRKNWHGVGAAVAVGGVIREAQLLADGLERVGFDVIRVHPTGKGKKMKHKEFCELTGWKGRSNKHTRDAALLALGWEPGKV